MKDSVLFTISKDYTQVTAEDVANFIDLHLSQEVGRLQELKRYYDGHHRIYDRAKAGSLSNNRIVANFPAYIADFTSGYLLGEPVSYLSDSIDVTPVTDALKKAGAPVQDADLAVDAAIFGRAYEVVYMTSDEKPVPKLAKVSPLNAFVVYDDTVEQKPVFGVYYYPVLDKNGIVSGYKGQYSTRTETFIIELNGSKNLSKIDKTGTPHPFGDVPIIEYYNNGKRTGDFEKVITLVDAYNLLQSDRVNDKEQFVDALLLIKGQVLGDTDEESAETYRAIKENKLMLLDADGDASFLTRQFDESSVDILRQAIENDIHKFSRVPNMSDQSFASNASGVAMGYKLLGLEQLTKIKERFFEEGLRIRLACLVNVLMIKGAAAIDLDEIDIQFKRSLPVNLLELSQIVNILQDKVPDESLLSLLPFVKDPQEAVEKLAEQQEEAVRKQQAMFMNTPAINNNGGDINNGGDTEI